MALKQVKVVLRNPLNKRNQIDYTIDVNDSSMGTLWFSALQDLLHNNNYLEKKTVPPVSCEPATTSRSAFNQPNDSSMDFNWTYHIPSSSLNTSYLPMSDVNALNLNK